MKIYFFGNEDVPEDNAVFAVVEKLKTLNENIEFIFVKPNEDLPFVEEDNVIILDTVAGIERVEEITEKDLDKLTIFSSLTVHDFDLGFQLQYLAKLGKLHRITIIGLPQGKVIDYERIQSILRKLVAQDIQGS
jgi:Ni,Fe-hydrogenase maturation factor